MSTTKLKLNKFRVSKLTHVKNIKGGETSPATTTNNTIDDPPARPLCINTSEEVINVEVTG